MAGERLTYFCFQNPLKRQEKLPQLQDNNLQDKNLQDKNLQDKKNNMFHKLQGTLATFLFTR